MNWPERRSLVAFGIRLTVIFALSLLPWPRLADGYVTVVARVTNPLLTALDAASSLRVRVEPPPEIRAEGSWKANLRVEDRAALRQTTFHLDMRSFSYRPMATFVALAAAASWSFRGARRHGLVWTVGLLVMFVLTTCFSALPLLSRFAAAGYFGVVPGLLVRTAYQALATPVMVYALPAIVWWTLTRATGATRLPAAVATA